MAVWLSSRVGLARYPACSLLAGLPLDSHADLRTVREIGELACQIVVECPEFASWDRAVSTLTKRDFVETKRRIDR
jgi:hypothetical protein